MVEVLESVLGGQSVVALRNEQVELAVTPALGAKLISLLDRRSGREWMWAADRTRPLVTVPAGSAFDDSQLIGMDECLPTVAPCEVDGVLLADHGELWNRSWELERGALAAGELVTEISLNTRPLHFRRTIGLSGNCVRFDYTLTNHSKDATTYAWAMHPSLALRNGDRLDIPGANQPARVDSASGLAGVTSEQYVAWDKPCVGTDTRQLLAGCRAACLKLYIPSAAAGEFVCSNPDGSQLVGRYGPIEVLPFLGVWVSRGGWNGYEHFAVEPTNTDRDRLDGALTQPAVQLAAGAQRSWFVEWIIGT